MVGERYDGLGWHIADYRGHLVIEHGGAVDGFRARIMLLPKEKLGAVLLTNVEETVVLSATGRARTVSTAVNAPPARPVALGTHAGGCCRAESPTGGLAPPHPKCAPGFGPRWVASGERNLANAASLLKDNSALLQLRPRPAARHHHRPHGRDRSGPARGLTAGPDG